MQGGYIESEGHLLEMGGVHELVILKDLMRRPFLGSFTCFSPHRHGVSTLDYILAPMALIPKIGGLMKFLRSIRIASNHAYISFTMEC